jgi:outer membrane protein OmpA-like peptidoglycan-associated protein
LKRINAAFIAMTMVITSLVQVTPAKAAGESISITTTAYSPGNAGLVGISLSGFDQTKSYQATVKFVDNATNVDVTNGTLTATQGSTTLVAGYDSFSAAKLGFKGTYSAISTALASVRWNPAAASGDISIRIGIASVPGNNEYYDANSGHYYRFVSSGLPWSDARIAAEGTTLFGLVGYLAEINSAAENTFIGTETTATNVWIGATDQATEGTWIWDGATSSPKPVGNTSNAGRSAAFHSWSDGEPNDFGTGEDCAVTNWGGARGKWNDLPCASSYSYLMEFGGRPGETSTAATATLTRTVTAVNPTVISVPAIGGVTVPATGGTPVSAVTAANGYTGTVTWSPTASTFAPSTSYTATITLTAASSYTLTGVAANFFTVAGATSVTHSANSGTITVVFPATLAAPAFTLSPGDESAIEGSAIIGYSITSTGGAIASYSISPAISNTPGLTFNSSTGRISGTPTTAASSRVYTITATNATASASRTFALTVNPPPPPPPPNEFKALNPPKISRDTTHYMCVAGTLLFLRNGSKEETPKITSQKYFLLRDGLTIDSVESMQSQVKFENKSSYLNSRISCTVEVLQENTRFTDSSLNSKLFTEANAIKRESLKQADAKHSSARTNAYSKKSSEFARITDVKAKEMALAKTSAAVLLASANYRKAFSAASELWKSELKQATRDREVARAAAEESYLQFLEKSGVSIYPRVTPAVVTATPTPTPTPTSKPTPTPSPTPTTNPQPTAQMVKVGTVYMASGSYLLNDQAKKILTTLAKGINAGTAKSVLVYGHADNRGGVNNTVLSQNRAKAVAAYLRPLLASKKISVGWFSSNKPVKTGTSASDLALNRRVEIYTK